jgi:hypothetical protein
MWYTGKNKACYFYLFLYPIKSTRKNTLLMLLATGMALGTGCNASKGGNENGGMSSTATDVLAEPSATDQAGTTSTVADSVEVQLADPTLQQQ